MTVLCVMTSVCWGQSYWNHIYNGIPVQMLSQSDSTTFILGRSNLLSGLGYNVLLIKINLYGDTLWTKSYGDSGDANPVKMILQQDGTVLIYGYTNYYGDKNTEIWLLKINSNGALLWKKIYGNRTDGIYPTDFLLQTDGAILIIGCQYVNGAQNEDIWISKVNSSGNQLWSKTFGGGQNDYPVQMFSQTDNSVIILASSVLPGGGNYSTWILKIDSNGDTLWTKKYAGEFSQSPIMMVLQSNGSILILGSKASYEPLSRWEAAWLMKINSFGDTLWTKTYRGIGMDSPLRALLQLDGSTLILGFADSSGNGDGELGLMKINSFGEPLWTKTYGKTNYDLSSQMTVQTDGSIIILSSQLSIESGDKHVWLLKIKPSGDTLWTKTFRQTDSPIQINIQQNGSILLLLSLGYFSNQMISIINDQYAYRNSTFNFKIPVDADSLTNIYLPLKVPFGMTISPGGTISWTPKTDSVYMDHVEFLVADDFGNKDTLTFNIFVNSSYHPAAIKPISHLIANKNRSFSINQTLPSQIKFNLSNGTSSLDIYDINGRCIQSLKPVNAQVVWSGLNSAGRPVSSGRYFAKIKDGSSSRMAEFSVVR